MSKPVNAFPFEGPQYLLFGLMLLAVHFSNEMPQLRRLGSIKAINACSETFFADGPDLVYGNFRFLACAENLHSAASPRVKFCRQWTDDYRIEVSIHRVLADDDYRPGLGNFSAARQYSHQRQTSSGNA